MFIVLIDRANWFCATEISSLVGEINNDENPPQKKALPVINAQTFIMVGRKKRASAANRKSVQFATASRSKISNDSVYPSYSEFKVT